MLGSLVACFILLSAALSPAMAVVAARADAVQIPRHDRIFMRYLWWPEGWSYQPLLTRAQQALLSDQGDFPTPRRVVENLYCIDMRQSGHDKRLQVWEKFLDVDFVFHNVEEYLESAILTVYHPPGVYDGKYYGPTSSEVKLKPGQQIVRSARWANPLVEYSPKSEKMVPAQDDLRRLLSTEVPILMAPFWLIRTMRDIDINNKTTGVGYREWFGIKKRADYFAIIGLNEDKAVKLFQEWRAVVDKSGISEQNRQVVLLRATTGFVWGTLDTFTEAGRGVARRNLRRGEFAHDAEEWIGHLPNGLPIVALFDKAGLAQDSAPDKIGPDNSPLNLTKDGRVQNGISCWRCHGVNKDYVRPIDDWARETFQKDKAILYDPDIKVTQELQSAYLRDLNRLIGLDRAEFSYAIARLTSTGPKHPGLTVSGFTGIYAGAWNQYVADSVTLEVASQELGVPKAKFLLGLQNYNSKAKGRGLSDHVLGSFLETPPKSIRRLSWEASYAFAQIIGNGIIAPEVIIKVKRLP